MNSLKRYKLFLLVLVANAILLQFRPELTSSLISNTSSNFIQMLAVIPPIFVLLGLLDIWVPREIVIKYMGKDSGLKGIILSIVLGASSAGPLYGAFPFAAIMLRKGVRISNTLIFLGAWSTLKVPMFLFELSALGPTFAITRWLLNIPAIVFIGFAIESLLTKEDQEQLLTTTSLAS